MHIKSEEVLVWEVAPISIPKIKNFFFEKAFSYSVILRVKSVYS